METTPVMRAAHLGWRLAQGLSDDLIISAAALIVAIVCGIVAIYRWPSVDLHSLTSPIRVFEFVRAIIPRATAAYAIHWAAKLLYCTCFFIFCHCQTPVWMLLPVKVVMKTGAAATWEAALARTVAGGVLGQLPLIRQTMRTASYLTALFNCRKEVLRDIAADTMLVYKAA